MDTLRTRSLKQCDPRHCQRSKIAHLDNTPPALEAQRFGGALKNVLGIWRRELLAQQFRRKRHAMKPAQCAQAPDATFRRKQAIGQNNLPASSSYCCERLWTASRDLSDIKIRGRGIPSIGQTS